MNFRRKHMKQSNKVPERWNDYSKIGKIVSGTRILPFKTPLRNEICRRLESSHRFTPEMLIEEVPNMKLIIDLTQTDRFYNKQDFTNKGVFYEKIVCPGGGKVLPSHSIILNILTSECHIGECKNLSCLCFINIFNGIINRFMQTEGRSNEDAVIGVHCTHGLNRTGYLICKYMISHCGFSPTEAIKEFEAARGHKMERPLYVEDIRNSSLPSRFGEPYSYRSQRPTTSHIPRRDRYRNNDHYGRGATRWDHPRERYHYNQTNSQRSHHSKRELPLSWRAEMVQNKHIRFLNED